MRKLLSQYTIIDWTSHLPGPYAAHLLANLGARVIKLQPAEKSMPFEKLEQTGPLALFGKWFKKFNENKDIVFYKDVSELQDIFNNADGIITNRDFDNFPENLKVTFIKSSLSDELPRHDLNILAESGFLAHHIELFKKKNETTLAPPALPWAGILFGQEIANLHLAQLLSNQNKQEISLQDIFNRFKDDLLPLPASPEGFLHSGAFPCYRLYQLGDLSWVALAAVEQKFWRSFCEYFNFEFSDEDRFEKNGSIVKRISNHLAKIDQDQLSNTESFCLTKVKAI